MTKMRRAIALPLLSLAALLFAGCAEPEAAGTSAVGTVDDVDCNEAALSDSEGDAGTFVGAFAVADGAIAGVCAGEPDARLDDAWTELTSVAPKDQLDALTVFAGFDDPESDVLAFATMLGETNEHFAIVVNLSAAEDDPDQLRLTLAHEMAHVFTQTPDQLDLAVDPADCPTFHNGNGCFRADSIVAEWIARFWTDEQLAQVEANAGTDQAGTDEAGSEKRCELDPTFPGAYAASSPEEDLAESFAAYTFGLDVPDDVRPRLEFFTEHPELSSFVEHAATDDRGRPTTPVELCGPTSG